MVKNTPNRILSLFVSYLLLFQPVWATQARIAPKQWEATYIHGSEDFEEESKMKISMASGELVFSNEDDESFSILPDQVETVFYDNQAHNLSVEWLKKNPLWYGLYDPVGIIFGLPLIGIGALVLLPFNSKDHYVHMVWAVEDMPHMAVFELGKNDYREFLDEISSMSGKPWYSLPVQRKQLKQELENAKDTKIPLHLNQDSRIFTIRLTPGLYQLVLLERSADLGELYFFRGRKVKSNKVLGGVIVWIIRRKNSTEEALAVSTPEEPRYIEKVILPEMTLLVLEESEAQKYQYKINNVMRGFK